MPLRLYISCAGQLPRITATPPDIAPSSRLKTVRQMSPRCITCCTSMTTHTHTHTLPLSMRGINLFSCRTTRTHPCTHSADRDACNDLDSYMVFSDGDRHRLERSDGGAMERCVRRWNCIEECHVGTIVSRDHRELTVHMV